MTILTSELKTRRPATVSDTAANGGRMSRHEIVSGVKNGIFPDVPLGEREAGVTRFRKVFGQVANDDDTTLANAVFHMTGSSNSEDWYSFLAGTQRDTQGDLTGSERAYSAAQVAVDAEAGATSFDLALEDAAQAACFADGDTVWIGDGTNAEYHADVTVSLVGLTLTVTLASGDMLTNNYEAGDAHGAAVCQLGDVACAVSAWLETSLAGMFNEAGHPVECDNLGTVEQDWTVTFTSATEFTISGDVVGDVGSGSISADAAPVNPNAGGRAVLHPALRRMGRFVGQRRHPVVHDLACGCRVLVPPGGPGRSGGKWRDQLQFLFWRRDRLGGIMEFNLKTLAGLISGKTVNVEQVARGAGQGGIRSSRAGDRRCRCRATGRTGLPAGGPDPVGPGVFAGRHRGQGSAGRARR